MASDTNIAWTEKSWNPTRGCERVSPGCKKCYAEIMAARHSYPGGWGEHLAKWVTRPDGTREARWTGVMQMVPGLLDWPLRRRKPSRIFVNSTSDLFHKDVPADFIGEVFGVMKRCPQHTFQILTKRPERMLMMMSNLASHGPDYPLRNVHLGVSVEDQDTADERIPLLRQTPAAVRWISAEPLLGAVDVDAFLRCRGCGYTARDKSEQMDHHLCRAPTEALDWVVIGGESGSDPRPMDMEHARDLIAQCKAAGVPVFVKQDSGPRPGMQGRFTDEEFALREYPA